MKFLYLTVLFLVFGLFAGYRTLTAGQEEVSTQQGLLDGENSTTCIALDVSRGNII